MEYRLAQEKDYMQLANMKWSHCEEDDNDYNETNLVGADKESFIKTFIEFIYNNPEYKIFVASEEDVVISAMFVYLIPKTPKPNRKQKYIAYLTNVYTLKEYRNKLVGTELMGYIKKYLQKDNCELLFAWPSEKSMKWYERNEFKDVNEMVECDLED